MQTLSQQRGVSTSCCQSAQSINHAATSRVLPHLVVGQKHTVEHFIQDALPASLLQRLVRLAIQDAHLQGQMIELSIDCKQVQPKRLECS